MAHGAKPNKARHTPACDLDSATQPWYDEDCPAGCATETEETATDTITSTCTGDADEVTSDLTNVMETVAGHEGHTVNGADLQSERTRIVEDESEDGWHSYMWPVHLHADNPDIPTTTVLKEKRAYVTLITAFDGL